MASHDPEELFPKLDAMGLKVVEEKLAAGAFGQRKVPVVRLWIERQKNEEVPDGTYVFPVPPDPGVLLKVKKFYLDHWKWIWSTIFVVVFGILGIVVV